MFPISISILILIRILGFLSIKHFDVASHRGSDIVYKSLRGWLSLLACRFIVVTSNCHFARTPSFRRLGKGVHLHVQGGLLGQGGLLLDLVGAGFVVGGRLYWWNNLCQFLLRFS